MTDTPTPTAVLTAPGAMTEADVARVKRLLDAFGSAEDSVTAQATTLLPLAGFSPGAGLDPSTYHIVAAGGVMLLALFAKDIGHPIDPLYAQLVDVAEKAIAIGAVAWAVLKHIAATHTQR